MSQRKPALLLENPHYLPIGRDWDAGRIERPDGKEPWSREDYRLPGTLELKVQYVLSSTLMAWAVKLAAILCLVGCQHPSDEQRERSRAVEPVSSTQQKPALADDQEGKEPNVYFRLGIVSADLDTDVERYLDSVGGINQQCRELNDLVNSVCCERFSVGCELDFSCGLESIAAEVLMDRTPYYYEWVAKRPVYELHHGSVVRDVESYLDKLAELSQERNTLLVGYTRHPLLIDDEETKDRAKKVNPNDLRFHWLGMVLPDRSDRGGTQILLDYYACRFGLLLSVAPVNKTALTQAVAEYRASTFSFDGKQFTGTGARDLFRLEGGRLVPNRLGCVNLARR